MINHFLSSAKSFHTQLSLLFSVFAILMGGLCLLLLIGTLHWTEDRILERRLIVDSQYATQLLIETNASVVQINPITTAYNSWKSVPPKIREYAQAEDDQVSEFDYGSVHESMLYQGSYIHQGIEYPLILVSRIHKLEINLEELATICIIALILIMSLMLFFNTLTRQLAQRFITPINTLTQQLQTQAGETNTPFVISKYSAKEMKILTEHLNQYRHTIHQLIKREQAFARYSSHELRTPLTIMSGSCNLLERSDQTTFQEKQTQRIQAAAFKMSTIVDALLGLVRYEKTRKSTEKRKITNTEIQSIIEQQDTQNKPISFTIKTSSTPIVRANEAVILIVISNLIRNAIAAMEAGTIHIKITEKHLTIYDEGTGIAPKPDANGHQLGLFIVQAFCERYQWLFSLENRATKGCKARITFSSE